jgi:cobalt-zinc-cadmium efflux system membrane fusion protein
MQVHKQVVLTLFACVLLTGCSSQRDESADARASEPASIENAIQVATVCRGKISPTVDCTGQIRPRFGQEILVSARLKGRLLRALVEPGQDVIAGQKLGYIDSQQISDLQAEAIQAASKLAMAAAREEREKRAYQQELLRPKELIEARASAQRAGIALGMAQRDYDRASQLYKEKIVAAKDYYLAEANLQNAKVEVERLNTERQREQELFNNKALIQKDWQLAHAETQQCQKELDTIKARLAFLGFDKEQIGKVLNQEQVAPVVPIIAPAPGTVVQQHVAPGEIVGPDTPILTLCDLSEVAVKCDLPEADVAAIKLGLPVEASVQAYPNRNFAGKITFVGSKLDHDTRTVPLRAVMDNRDRLLKLDMFVDVRIKCNAKTAVLCPRDAVHHVAERTVVYVRKADRGFEQRQISTGIADGDLIEVVNGLSEGEQVATKGSLLLQTKLSMDKRE